MSDLLTASWWKAALIRALRTALVIAVPYAPTVIYDGSYIVLASAAGFGALTSLITSLFGLAETEGKTVTWGAAIFERVVKTSAQALLTAFGTATLFSEVNWNEVLPLVASAALGSLLLGVLKQLPESAEPLAPVTTTVQVYNAAVGEVTEQEIPVVIQTSQVEAETVSVAPDREE